MTANLQQELNQIIERSKRATRLDTLIQGYRLCARTEGKSDKTILIATTALNKLRQFLESRRYPTDVIEIGTQELREFIGYLQNTRAFMEHPFTGPQKKGLTGHTVNCYLRALRAFWSWLEAEEFIDINPFNKIIIPKPPKKIMTPFSEEQVRTLLSVIDTKSATGFRDWTIILTLLDTGVRVSELTNLGLEDVNLVQRSLKVHGKGNKERIVPIGISVQRALAKYSNKYRPTPPYPLSDNLFLTRDGMSLTPNRVQSIIEQYASRANIQGVRASPHTFTYFCCLIPP